MSNKVIITVNEEDVEVITKPNDTGIEVRNYTLGEYPCEQNNIKVDKNGDRYQEFLFPAEKKEIEEYEDKYLNYYVCTCEYNWMSKWDCTCNDKCPQCNKEISPYRSDGI